MRKILTSPQERWIKSRVRAHHSSLLVELLGDSAVSKSVLAMLHAEGLYRTPRIDVIKSVFAFGRETLVNKDVLRMSAAEFSTYLASNNITMSVEEQMAVETLRRSFQAYMDSLGDTMSTDIEKALIQADKSFQKRVAQRQRKEVFVELEKKKAFAEISKSLSEITKTQLGNASRTIATETNNAFQDGRATEILRKAAKLGISDPDVFKLPRHDACPECVKAYLVDGTSTPKVFKLSTLIDNGTNIGKSKAARLPVLESHHPWCFPGDTTVVTANGVKEIRDITRGDFVVTHTGQLRPVVGVSRRKWAGNLVQTGKVASTPNHPFLTSRGWIPAEALQSGDQFFSTATDILSSIPENNPPIREQPITLGGILSNLFFRLVPASTINLYRQFVDFGCEVYVEFVYGHEGLQWQLFTLEDEIKRFLKIGKTTRFFNSAGSFNELLDGSCAAPARFVRARDSRYTLFSGHFFPHNFSGLLCGSDGNIMVSHISDNSFSGCPEDAFHLQNRSFLGVMQAIKYFLGNVFSPTHGNLLTRTVPNMHKHVNRLWFEGNVYNLSVFEDESYIANGIVVHNCACELFWKPPGFEFDQGGRMVYSGSKLP